jgi:thiamine-phosphate pyrophosphorylase
MIACARGDRLRGIYAIVDPGAHRDASAYAAALLRAGIRIVQLRDKRGPRASDVASLRDVCRAAGALLIVNDDVELARLADGVHLGPDDLAGRTIAGVRGALGDLIIGVSASTPAEAAAAYHGGADYLGAGPFSATRSKADAGEPIGEAGLRRVVAASPLPVAAIGGVTIDDLDAIVRAGARMAAVISALAAAAHPELAAAAMVRRWNALTA